MSLTSVLSCLGHGINSIEKLANKAFRESCMFLVDQEV
jgi:hypothetical protein